MEPNEHFILLLLRQFAGGPGPPENNLTRFGLAAIFWLVLLIIAWSRQRNQNLPREKLLIWGFGAALIRELIMFGLTTWKITGFLDSWGEDTYYYPLEHGLAMTAVVVVAGAFLRYALKDERLSRRYLQIGLSMTILASLIAFITWPKLAYSSPGLQFNQTWASLLFHALSTFLLVVAIILLIKKREWLRVVVSIALGFLLISEFLFLLSSVIDNEINYILCPISNAFHILAIPIFGFVYLTEMSIEKNRTEDKLDNYRDHLEDLVNERTSMLVAQNEIADSLSHSLDLETILHMALDKVLSVLSMQVGLIFLLDREGKGVSLKSYRGRLSQEDLDLCIKEGSPYKKISKDAIDKQTVIQTLTDKSLPGFTHIKRERIHSLVSVPLISKDHIIGALTLGSIKADLLDQTNLELLTAVCNQIGMAVENAYLYQEAEIWAGELSTLHQASVNLGSTLDAEQINKEIATQSVRLTGRQMACVIYWDEQCEKLEIISSIGIKSEMEVLLNENPSACELLDELSMTRNSIVINDIQRDARIPESWKMGLDIHSLLCTPIWGTDEPVEFLFIMDQRKSKFWRSKDVELVESFISQAAVALENANLYKQLEWAATLEERQRIAADMHDGVAQIISLLGFKVDNIAEFLPSESSGDLLEGIKDIRETVDQALIEARKSISSLQTTPQPRKSLQEILTSLVEQWSAEWIDGNEFVFNTSFSEPLFLPPNHIAQVVPIIQEAIINARKHSDATQIQIKEQQLDGQVTITIEDNGRGFDVDGLIGQGGSHFGLKIMRGRAARFGGKLQIVSKPDCVTIVTLSWILGREKEGRKDGLLRNSARPNSLAVEGKTYV